MLVMNDALILNGSGISISMDHTFKVANKAIVVTPEQKRVKVMKGGLLSVLNEESEILVWVSICYKTDIVVSLTKSSQYIATLSNPIPGGDHGSSRRFETAMWFTWCRLPRIGNSR